MSRVPDPIRLVHVTTVPVTLAAFLGGHVAYARARGCEVHAISSPGPQLERFGAVLGIPVHAIPMARRMAPLEDLASLWRLHRALRSIRPDIVHVHTPKAGLLGTIAARTTGTRVVVLSVFGLPQMTRSGLPRRLLDLTTRLSCRLADRVWCDSHSMRDYLIQRGLCPTGKVCVLGHGSVDGVDAQDKFSPARFDPSARDAIRRRYGIPPGAPVIGFVGRVVRDKGMGELAGAWRSLRDQAPAPHLLLVGPLEPQDPLEPDDEAMFREDARVHLAGPTDDVPAHLAAMDIYVMPSHREGFGVSNIEAAAMELPVVSTRIPGCVDSVADGLTGMLVPPRDAGALAAALRAYLRDPDLRRRHGRAGRERVLRDFRPEAIRGALYREYQRLLRGHSIPDPDRPSDSSTPAPGPAGPPTAESPRPGREGRARL